MAENDFAESIELVPRSKFIKDIRHLLTPDLRESEKPGLGVFFLVFMLLRQFRPAPNDRNNRAAKVNVI